MRKVTQNYSIENEEGVELFKNYLKENDLPFTCHMSSNDGADFEVMFYNALERDECDNWIEENLY